MYPKGRVEPGGITDRLLSDYQAFIRDEQHARGFFARHQDKLLYGSDCSDRIGRGATCSGSLQIASVRRFAPDKEAERKIFFGNAPRVLKLKV